MVDTEIDSVTQERKRNIGKERGEERGKEGMMRRGLEGGRWKEGKRKRVGN